MSGNMRAAVYRGGRTLVLEDLPIPSIQPGELLVRVRACGVCGTDLKKIQYGLLKPPRIFGHETVGEVVELGKGVREWSVGDRVALNHHVPCERDDCYYCNRQAYAQCPIYKVTGTTAGFEPAGGGFSQYVRVMDWCACRGTIRIPEHSTTEEAIFIEPLNTCLKGVKLAGIRSGDTVLVVGQGPIGLLFTMLASGMGATVIATDKLAHRRAEALARGAKAAIDPCATTGDRELTDRIMSLTSGRGADIAIVAVPDTRVISNAFAAVRPAGKILLFAQTQSNDSVHLDAAGICMQEKALIGSYSSDISLQEEAAGLVFSRKVDVRGLVTHRFTLESITEAIDIATTPRDNSLKILVTA